MSDGPGQIRRRLLVVDDSRLILDVVRDYFGERGYAVDTARDAEGALRRVDEAAPDVILADVALPGTDGWTLFDRVRDRPGLGDVAFVFLTTGADPPPRLGGARLEREEYVVKPFDVEEVHARVGRLLDRRETAPVVRSPDEPLLSGSLDHLSLADLLQVLCQSGRDGVVVVTGESSEGRVVLEGGAVIDAACAPVDGEKALYRMLGWRRAGFRVVETDGRPRRTTIHAPVQGLIMEGLVSLDEWNRFEPSLPSRETSFRVDPRLRESLDAELSPAEREVIARASAGEGRGEMLDRSERPDGELAAALCRCLERGVLRARR